MLFFSPHYVATQIEVLTFLIMKTRITRSDEKLTITFTRESDNISRNVSLTEDEACALLEQLRECISKHPTDEIANRVHSVLSELKKQHDALCEIKDSIEKL